MSHEDKLPLSNAQQEILHKQRVSFLLSPYEVGIIKAMREVRFGQFSVHIHNGIPSRYTLGSSHVVDPKESIESSQ